MPRGMHMNVTALVDARRGGGRGRGGCRRRGGCVRRLVSCRSYSPLMCAGWLMPPFALVTSLEVTGWDAALLFCTVWFVR